MLTKYFIVTLFTVCAFQQKVQSQSLPSTYERYQFLKWYVKQYGQKGWSDSLIHLEDEHSKLANINDQKIELKISKADMKYFKRQIIFNNQFKRLNKEMLANAAWKQANDYSKGNWISMPIFSMNRKIAIINSHYYCGPLCGRYGTEIYIKENGNWKQSKFTPPKVES
jgi:hypothetical protein